VKKVQEETNIEIPVEHESDMKAELFANIQKLNEHLRIIVEKSVGILEKKSLDLMFIMDCTSSMSSWIRVCKQEIQTIVDRIIVANQGCDVRLSFIGYTDFDQKNQKMFDILDFTSDPQEF
jgi:vacuole morphology and inheritance protein 14